MYIHALIFHGYNVKKIVIMRLSEEHVVWIGKLIKTVFYWKIFHEKPVKVFR